ncbi:MAG: dephospho-CoA kinase [Planctomycetes bacterium]|nr:dephospho-CoA kinase [Planctomycetota bacterium]
MIEFRPNPAITIGLVGGVASGKSTVAGLLADRGLVRLDADAEARAVTATPAVLERIVERFGSGVLDANGRLDRAALAAIVFDDRERLHELESIVHPAVRRALHSGIREAHARGDSVVLDVPLLLEGSLAEECEVCIFLEVDDATRAERARGRGWDDGELARREANQMSLQCKKAKCAYTVDTSGSLSSTVRQVDEILARIASSSGS